MSHHGDATILKNCSCKVLSCACIAPSPNELHFQLRNFCILLEPCYHLSIFVLALRWIEAVRKNIQNVSDNINNRLPPIHKFNEARLVYELVMVTSYLYYSREKGSKVPHVLPTCSLTCKGTGKCRG